jgi:hypothetical protein
MKSEFLTVEVVQGTTRRLEQMGFPYDVSGRDVVRFLIEEGLGVLEKHRNTAGGQVDLAEAR